MRVSNETNERRNFLEEERKEREKIFFLLFFDEKDFVCKENFLIYLFPLKKRKRKKRRMDSGSRFNFMVVIRIFPGGRGKRRRDFDAR